MKKIRKTPIKTETPAQKIPAYTKELGRFRELDIPQTVKVQGKDLDIMKSSNSELFFFVDVVEHDENLTKWIIMTHGVETLFGSIGFELAEYREDGITFTSIKMTDNDQLVETYFR